MKEIQLKLNGESYKLKYSFRSLMMFEEMTSRRIDQINQNVTDTITLFYCILKACNRDTFKYDFDQFVDAVDEFPTALEAFNSFLMDSKKEVEEPEVPKKKRVKA